MSPDVLGKPHDRIEGRLKVTGRLRYSGDQPIENVAYGYLVTSTIARGEIRALDVSETEQSPAVAAVYTPVHSLKLYNGLRFFADCAAKKWPLRGSKSTDLRHKNIFGALKARSQGKHKE